MLAVNCDDQAADRELLLEFCARYAIENPANLTITGLRGFDTLFKLDNP